MNRLSHPHLRKHGMGLLTTIAPIFFKQLKDQWFVRADTDESPSYFLGFRFVASILAPQRISRIGKAVSQNSMSIPNTLRSRITPPKIMRTEPQNQPFI